MQGTVLGPLMFLIYINDIGKNLSCCLRLFADDCLLYHVITSEDYAKLQRDLNTIPYSGLFSRGKIFANTRC